MCVVAGLKVEPPPPHPLPVQGEVLGHPEDGVGGTLALVLLEFLIEAPRCNPTKQKQNFMKLKRNT